MSTRQPSAALWVTWHEAAWFPHERLHLHCLDPEASAQQAVNRDDDFISSIAYLLCSWQKIRVPFSTLLSLPCKLVGTHSSLLGSPFTSRSCFLLCPLSSQGRWKVSRIQDPSCHLHFQLNSLSHHESNTEKAPLTHFS